jgi:8-oxo-dGTP diphosphatase
MATERFIENNVIRSRERLGLADAPFIRRCRAGRGYGIVDLLFLPASGPHDVVLVEAKRASSPDATAKVVGQLLLYLAGLSRFGSDGLGMLRKFAVEHRRKARSVSQKLLKTISGISPPEAAWSAMQCGERLERGRIALWVALDAHPPAGLKDVLAMLAAEQAVTIGIISVMGRDALEIWRPSGRPPMTNAKREPAAAARKSDWRIQPLPRRFTTINLSRTFDPGEMRRIQAGLVPREMEEKWFIYWEANTLFFHRSWTGVCIYAVRFAPEGDSFRMVQADVNRDPEQYEETSDVRDAKLISYLIDVLLLERDSEFPCGADDSADAAIMEWGLSGKAMLGRLKRPGEDSERGAGSDGG